MSRLTEVREVDGCIDSVVVKEFCIDPAIDEGLMRSMASGARLSYYPHFPRPYFRIERSHAYVVQGSLGSSSFRVTFSPSADAGVERDLTRLIEEGPCGPSVAGTS